MEREAKFWEVLEGKKVRCNLCRRHCIILPGRRGVCMVRENRDGKLISLSYGNVVSIAIDPIEKKPLFNFKPGTEVLSYSTMGCNFKCRYCQNWEISQALPEEVRYEEIPAEVLVEIALQYKTPGIAHTYTEPTIFYEYAFEVSKIAKEKGLFNVWVTNGYIEKEPLKEIRPYLDAANIDLKAFNEKFYKDLCGGIELDEVLDSIKYWHKLGIHIELTNLIIPGWNDSFEEIRQMVKWIIENLGRDVPLHFTRFFPHYKMIETPITPLETLLEAYNIAKEEGLYYVYIGNVWPNKYENTYCYNCGELLIERDGYYIKKINLEKKGNRVICPTCGKRQNIIL